LIPHGNRQIKSKLFQLKVLKKRDKTPSEYQIIAEVKKLFYHQGLPQKLSVKAFYFPSTEFIRSFFNAY